MLTGRRRATQDKKRSTGCFRDGLIGPEAGIPGQRDRAVKLREGMPWSSSYDAPREHVRVPGRLVTVALPRRDLRAQPRSFRRPRQLCVGIRELICRRSTTTDRQVRGRDSRDHYGRPTRKRGNLWLFISLPAGKSAAAGCITFCHYAKAEPAGSPFREDENERERA